ncbi:hypothetical protein Nepgr_016871 [Nepenthes gracilis]|uniref:Uncharacterized protein n=1 Tax=Nepenthes gracilis TaxID=150966 RepID=A0AAD3XSW2_NEPGR|nr:hypothetical protein Nepgr_016871 [Nepenthes gracilis]
MVARFSEFVLVLWLSHCRICKLLLCRRDERTGASSQSRARTIRCYRMLMCCVLQTLLSTVFHDAINIAYEKGYYSSGGNGIDIGISYMGPDESPTEFFRYWFLAWVLHPL